MSSAICFNLDLSKILLSGSGLMSVGKELKHVIHTVEGNNKYKKKGFREVNPFPNKLLFLHVFSTSLLKTLLEMETLLITSNFSFSNSVCYSSGELYAIFIKFIIDVCILFQFCRV